jgi:23S rRNA G2445 N2-methylase RlmL
MHIRGAMDPTIAFAVNSLCNLENATSYMNPCAGSGTLLIEAAHAFDNLNKVIGFDNNKRHLSTAIRNIKKANLITKVRLFERDIMSNPDFGKFDAITSDLPFGMIVGKGDDLQGLYAAFVRYCSGSLNRNGIAAIYTTKNDLFKQSILNSSLTITKTLSLKLVTSVDSYIYPKIFICKIR